MTLEQVAFGAAGAVLALGKLYYTLGILRNLRAVDEATIAMTFPHGRAQVALKALLGAFLVFAAGMALGSIGLAHAMPVLDT
ncbi:MAG: hypothetical protein SVU88_03280, partial [Candidatus Nanohaloarchaea archaeon]|nr:hypothetical protein [Candidatus Nanohaloarchaea archaeon]